MRQGLLKGGFIASLALLGVSAGGLGLVVSYFKYYTKKEAIYPESGLLVTSLPPETPSWVREGSDRIEPPEIIEVLGTKNYVSRMYRTKEEWKPGRGPLRVQFHAAYYTGGIDTVPHVPDRCFVGGGMQIGTILGNLPLEFDRTDWSLNRDVPEHLSGRIWKTYITNEHSKRAGDKPNLPRDPETMRLRTMGFLGPQDEKEMFAGYFFIANGGTVCRAEDVRLLAFDLTSKYAYYLKVQVTSSDVESGEELAEAATSLVGEMLGDIMLCVPDWVRVEMGEYPPREEGDARGGEVAVKGRGTEK